MNTGLQNSFRHIHMSWNRITWLLAQKCLLISTITVYMDDFQTPMTGKIRRLYTMGGKIYVEHATCTILVITRFPSASVKL